MFVHRRARWDAALLDLHRIMRPGGRIPAARIMHAVRLRGMRLLSEGRRVIRPMPPERLTGGFGLFEPAHDVARWARALFIAEGAPLENEQHGHLQHAEIGFVWTNQPNERRGRMLLGTCQLLPPSGDKWSAGARIQQLEDWFGDVPDFLIHLYAPAANEMDDASFMALVEHELSHAGQAQDRYGMPSFNKETGKPVWTMRGHCVEEFVNVVARYGADATGVRAMVDAAAAGPTIAQAQIDIACGNCIS